MNEEVQRRILQITGFQRGEFPFRYLGIPISSKKLNKNDCDLLVDKMLKRVTSWSSRHLSYAGRVTLVNAVLLYLQTYWAQIFLLPKSVLHKITQICRAYLWDRKVYLAKSPPVAWSWVCMLKKNGGLGIRDCITWNMAAVGKLLWQIAQKEDVLWIKWIHNVYVKEQTWWEYKAPPNASWIWKGVCKAKEVLKAGYNNNNWGTCTKQYNANEGYKWLKGQYEAVGWHHWAWNGLNVPKHAFISWLVALGKVKTRERLKAAGVCNDEAYLMCKCTKKKPQLGYMH